MTKLKRFKTTNFNEAVVEEVQSNLRLLAEINQKIDSSEPLRFDFSLADSMRSKKLYDLNLKRKMIIKTLELP